MTTTRNAGITGDFIHKPLQSPGSEIRLIHVQPSEAGNDEISCTISTHPIGNAPPYAAISYTWGDMTRTCTISLEGKHVSIGENSWLVLWQVRLHRLPLPLWIDVLSINQADDHEKSVQVSIMGAVYQAAKFTCVSLGSHGDDSEFLAEQIRVHAYHVEHVQSMLRVANQDSTPCSACGASPTPRMYRCRGCVESSRFCMDCKISHEDESSHKMYLDVRTEARLRDDCVKCEQPLSTRWYQPAKDEEGHLKKVCESCAEAHRNGPDVFIQDCEHVHMNEWEHMNRPAKISRWILRESQTLTRIFDLPKETHQRIIDALRLLSLRPYFSRLWIIQELARSNSVVMLCGESLFHLWKLDVLEQDLTAKPKADVYQQRWRDVEIRFPSWYLQMLLDFRETDADSSIWDLVDTYYASYCSDPRDRVFGLLPMADSASRRTFHPDYTQSFAEIVLRLLDSKAKLDEEEADARHYDFQLYTFRNVHNIIGVSGLGPDDPDVAVMLAERRRDFQEIISSSDTTQGELPRQSNDSQRLFLDVNLHCTIWQNGAGEFVAPLSSSNTWRGASPPEIDAQTEADGAIPLRIPDGTIVGWADKQIQPADSLLFFLDGNNSTFHAGLVVRQPSHETDIPAAATIVGQFIIYHDVKFCPGDSSCECGRCHSTSQSDRKLKWSVHMSPEDLLVFIAQDLRMEHRQPKRFEVPMVDVAVRWEESAKRLSTRVTFESLSSYAVLK